MVDNVATGNIQSALRSTMQNLWRKRRHTFSFPSWLPNCKCMLNWREVSTCQQIVTGLIQNKSQQQLGGKNPLLQRNSSKGLCILLGNKNCELHLHLEKMISLGIYTGYLAPNLNNNTVHQPLVVVHRQRTFIDIRLIKPDANSWFKSGLCKYLFLFELMLILVALWAIKPTQRQNINIFQ